MKKDATDTKNWRERLRRWRVPLIAGVGIIVVAVIALVVWQVVRDKTSEPEKAARRFVTAFLDGRCASALEQLSAATDRRLAELAAPFSPAAEPQGINLKRRACDRLGRVASEEAKVTKTELLLESADKALVRVTSTPADQIAPLLRSLDLYLVKDEDGWKIDLGLNVLGERSLLAGVLDDRPTPVLIPGQGERLNE